MFENLIKSKLNIKEQDNLLIIEYKKWSFKLPIYLLIIYILYFDLHFLQHFNYK